MPYRMLVFVGFIIVAGACSAPNLRVDAISLPADVNIVPPSDSIPENIAAFSGRWEGSWYGTVTKTHTMDQILIVERIDSPTSAQIVTAGVVQSGRNTGERWSGRKNAEFVDGALRYPALNGEGLVSYRMTSDGTLAGIFETPYWVNKGTFVRAGQ